MNTQVLISKPESRAYLKNLLSSFIESNHKENLDQLISANIISLVEQLCPHGPALIGSYQATAIEPNLSLPTTWNTSYPVVESDTQINFYTNPSKEFVTSSFGIKEPTQEVENLKEALVHDALIIPAVGFNQSGYRLGHGGGYYDRYLSNINKIKIGVGYSVQFTDGLWSPEEHDIQLDYIVTEKYVIKINN